MKNLKKIFGGLDLSWHKLILFAILSGIYTALMALIPCLQDTSLHDITVTFEVWILFGIIIIMNSKSSIDSALKCFVFFLISQPLVYLIQVPFSSLGFGIFVYYKYWFIWTILTFFMGYIGYYIKKDNWLGIIILLPILILLAFGSYHTYLLITIFNFPYHLLTTIFCLITLIIYPLCIFNNKKNKIITLIISIVLIIIFTIMAFKNKLVYNPTLLISDSTNNITFNDSAKVYLENNIGKVYIHYVEGIEDYAIEGEFTRAGKTNLVLIDELGNKYVFKISIGYNTYSIEKISD